MTPQILRLLEVAEQPLLALCERQLLGELMYDSRAGALELAAVLSRKNGFYAFDGALLVRPLSCSLAPLGIREWNEPGLWKYEYGESLNGLLCFAEDLFGVQFAMDRETIVAIDPETGECEQLATTLNGWADVILRDSDFRTGYRLAHDWYSRHGPLPAGCRLLPRIPFVTGGKFEIANLYPVTDVEGMRFRGSIARQIRDVPDGGFVVFRSKEDR